MQDFDVEGFVGKLTGMGMTLKALRFADGTYRICPWRFQHPIDHTQEIAELWQSEVGDDQTRIDFLAAHLAQVDLPITASII
jgi:hypothetical protein